MNEQFFEAGLSFGFALVLCWWVGTAGVEALKCGADWFRSKFCPWNL